jgi:hypothetical protein
MHDQNYHHIGTLLPKEGRKPRWAQLYIYIYISMFAFTSIGGMVDKEINKGK